MFGNVMNETWKALKVTGGGRHVIVILAFHAHDAVDIPAHGQKLYK